MGLLSGLKGFFSWEYTQLEGARPLSAAEQRGLAMGAVYAADMALPMNALTAQASVAIAAKLLDQAWDVRVPDDVMPTYANLLERGHREYYAYVAPLVERLKKEFTNSYSSTQRAWAKELEESVPAGAVERGLDPGRALGYYKGWSASYFAGGHAELVSPLPTSIVAWDAARVVHVSRLMIDAGLVDERTAYEAIAQAVDLSRPAYASWREFGQAFVVGRAFWTSFGDGRPDPTSGSLGRKVDQLLEKQGSPWLTVPW